ncbi:MAG: PIN domain-containing protein [Burkholderiales bacterium]|nr:PIN domain-containing protein [Burkholderiales bacterium]
MSAVFVDTNVLLYAFDPREPVKRERSQAWLAECWQRRCGRVSSQVMHEFYANARKRFASAIAAGDARSEVRRYQQWKPWLVDQATVETAWAVESRYRLGYWDALMIAAAQHMGCRWLLTEDLQHEQRIEQLTIVNPFLVGPELLETEAPT